MYEKNLTQDLRLRLSENDMNFLRELSANRCVSVSECIRSIIGDYRRSLETIDALKNVIALTNNPELSSKIEVAVHGDTKTNINNKL